MRRIDQLRYRAVLELVSRLCGSEIHSINVRVLLLPTSRRHVSAITSHVADREESPFNEVRIVSNRGLDILAVRR